MDKKQINIKWHLQNTIQSIKRLQNEECNKFNLMRMKKEFEFGIEILNKMEAEILNANSNI